MYGKSSWNFSRSWWKIFIPFRGNFQSISYVKSLLEFCQVDLRSLGSEKAGGDMSFLESLEVLRPPWNQILSIKKARIYGWQNTKKLIKNGDFWCRKSPAKCQLENAKCISPLHLLTFFLAMTHWNDMTIMHSRLEIIFAIFISYL